MDRPRIPDGVTLKDKNKNTSKDPWDFSKERGDQLAKTLEKLSEVLEGKDKQQVEAYKKQIILYSEQIEKLEEEKKEREKTARSYGLSRSDIGKVVSDYEKAIDASTKQLIDASVEIGKSVSDISSKEGVQELLSEEDRESFKRFGEVSKDILDSRKERTDGALTKQIKSSASYMSKTMLDNTMNMFGMITKPLEGLLGIDLSSAISGGFSKLFSKKDKDESDPGKFLSKRISPTREAIRKQGIIGASAVYIGGLFEKLFPKKTDGGISLGGDGLLDGVQGLFKKENLPVGAAVLSLGVGLIWAVVDSIKGIFKAEEWGTSKVSAGIAGFLAGDGEGGIKNAFKNMGKWALIGAGVGSFVPVIGTIAGGLIGAAIGGILGWIGAEKIAGAFDSAYQWVKDQLFGDGFIGELFGPLISGIRSVIDGVKEKFENIKNILGDDELSVWGKIKGVAKEIILGILEIPLNFLKGGFINIIGEERWGNIQDILGDEEATIWQKVKGVSKEILTGIWDKVTSIGGKLLEGADNLIKSFLNEDQIERWESLKENIKDWSGMIFGPIFDGWKNMFSGWKDRFTNIKDILGDEETSVWEKIKGVAKEIILGIVEAPYNLVKGWLDGLFKNEKFLEIKEKMSGWFSNISEKISDWIWGHIPEWLQTALSFVGVKQKPGKDVEYTEQGAPVTKKVLKTIEKAGIENEEDIAGYANYQAISDVLYDHLKLPKTILNSLIEFDPAKRFLAQVGMGSRGEIESAGSIARTNAVSELRKLFKTVDPITVKDAVIYKDGQWFRPDEEDHIIATKTPPAIFNKEGSLLTKSVSPTNEVAGDFSGLFSPQPIGSSSNESYFINMVQLLSSILDVLKDKEMAPTFNEFSFPSTLDFELMR